MNTVFQSTALSSMSSNNKRGSGDGGPPPKRLEAPALPPDPPDPLEIAMTARVNANLPPQQCLLQFMNRDPGTLCYVGSGCNLLCCAPVMMRFLGRLPPFKGLPGMVRQLALRPPYLVRMFFNVLTYHLSSAANPATSNSRPSDSSSASG